MKYDVISLGNIPSEGGGFEVNDAHYTGKQIEIDTVNIETITKAMKDAGLFAKHVTRRMVYIDNAYLDASSIYLKRKRNDAWLYELRPAKD